MTGSQAADLRAENEQLRADLAARDEATATLTELTEQLRAELTARDAELTARAADVAARDEVIAMLKRQLVALAAEVAELKAQRAGRPPPPSSPKSENPTRRRKPKGRRRGGQKGRRGSHRVLLDESLMDALVDVYPPQCASCWAVFESPAPDPYARRYQHVEWDVCRPPWRSVVSRRGLG